MNWDLILGGAVGSIVYGTIGILLLAAGFKMFDLMTPKLDEQEELKNGNIAVAIVVGSLLLAIAYIAAHVVK